MAKSKLSDLSPFTRGYLTAAYWTSDESDDLGWQDYRATKGPENMHKRLSLKGFLCAIAACEAFKAANVEMLAQAGDSEQNGIDFWLTRNGHGSGFSDRDYDESVRDVLTKAARKMGESDLYKADNGKLYFSR